jgi:hypothetical protein
MAGVEMGMCGVLFGCIPLMPKVLCTGLLYTYMGIDNTPSKIGSQHANDPTWSSI